MHILVSVEGFKSSFYIIKSQEHKFVAAKNRDDSQCLDVYKFLPYL